MLRLRSDLEFHNRCYWDQLVCALKKSINEDVLKLQQYIDMTTLTLTAYPKTIDEIFEMNTSYTGVVITTKEVKHEIVIIEKVIQRLNFIDGNCL